MFDLYQTNSFMGLQTHVQQLRWLSLLFLFSTSPLERSHGLTNISRPMIKLFFLYLTQGCDLKREPKHCPTPLGSLVMLNWFLSTFLNTLEKILLLPQHVRLGGVVSQSFITGMGNPSQWGVISFYLEPRYIIWLILRQAPKMGQEITWAVAISFLWLKMGAEDGSIKWRGDVCI